MVLMSEHEHHSGRQTADWLRHNVPWLGLLALLATLLREADLPDLRQDRL
ncbi:hypothetical protein [Devosia sp. LC5]|nr:hypothetical protein [Devosia sp. LC5]